MAQVRLGQECWRRGFESKGQECVGGIEDEGDGKCAAGHREYDSKAAERTVKPCLESNRVRTNAEHVHPCRLRGWTGALQERGQDFVTSTQHMGRITRTKQHADGNAESFARAPQHLIKPWHPYGKYSAHTELPTGQDAQAHVTHLFPALLPLLPYSYPR